MKEVDARGSYCPGPLMELISVIRSADIGERIALLSSEPDSLRDVPTWVTNAGHTLHDVEQIDEGTWRFIITVER